SIEASFSVHITHDDCCLNRDSHPDSMNVILVAEVQEGLSQVPPPFSLSARANLNPLGFEKDGCFDPCLSNGRAVVSSSGRTRRPGCQGRATRSPQRCHSSYEGNGRRLQTLVQLCGPFRRSEPPTGGGEPAGTPQ